jgi:hypothetical protein
MCFSPPFCRRRRAPRRRRRGGRPCTCRPPRQTRTATRRRRARCALTAERPAWARAHSTSHITYHTSHHISYIISHVTYHVMSHRGAPAPTVRRCAFRATHQMADYPTRQWRRGILQVSNAHFASVHCQCTSHLSLHQTPSNIYKCTLAICAVRMRCQPQRATAHACELFLLHHQIL